MLVKIILFIGKVFDDFFFSFDSEKKNVTNKHSSWLKLKLTA